MDKLPQFNHMHYVHFLASRSRPNITGVFGRLSGLNGSDPGTFAGAFKVNGATNMSHGGDSGATNARNASFDASRSSATYGAISTVQPPAALMLACIRI